MPQKRNRVRDTKALGRAKNIVRGAIANKAPNITTLILDTLETLPSLNVGEFVKWVDLYPAQRKRIQPPRLCSGYRDLWPTRESFPEIGSFSTAIRWVHALLSKNSDLVSQYVAFLSDYETYLLTDDLSAALETVEAINNDLGFSIWAIEAKIALLQRLEGLEAQKKYSAAVRELAPDSLPGFIASYTSERNEDNVSFRRFAKKLERQIALQSTTVPIKKFITRRLLGLKGDDISVEDISHVLGVAGSLSIIDAYEGYIWACQTAVEKGLSNQFSSVMSASLSGLRVEDWRIEKLRAYLSLDFSRIPSRQLDAEVYLYQGRFEEAFEESMNQLSHVPDDIESVVSASAALAYGDLVRVDENPKQLSLEVMTLLSKVIAKGEGVASAANDLIKLVLNFRSLRGMAAIYGHLVTEWGEVLQIRECEATSVFLSSQFLNPSHWSVLSDIGATRLLDKIRAEGKSWTPGAGQGS